MPNNVDTPPFTGNLFLTRQVAQEMLYGLPHLYEQLVGITPTNIEFFL
jgi:hypothetical protein